MTLDKDCFLLLNHSIVPLNDTRMFQNNFKFPSDTKAVIWDFDGVIKDSLAAKTGAFLHIFDSHANNDLLEKIKSHHLKNGGISRSVKIPLYLKWLGIEPTKSNIDKYLDEFGKVVVELVVNSPWVKGVEKLLHKKNKGVMYFLITGTPTTEIYKILSKLSLLNPFTEIIGYPTEKFDATKGVIEKYNLSPKNIVYIGDSEIDMRVSQMLNIPFILRLHADNMHLKNLHGGTSITDFLIK